MPELPNGAETRDYESFQRDNRYRVNHSLNKILWFCILAGPAIALGIMGGAFKQTSYRACAVISLGMAAVAGGNLLVLKKKPYSYVPGVFALVAVDILLCCMNASHISIRLTWFLVPLLSLLFSDRKTYIGISVLNYLIMALGIWLESAHYAEIRTDFSSSLSGFINIFSGCTIEAVIMFAAGYSLGRTTNNYYRKMIGQHAEAQVQEQTMRRQLEILDSMAEIYDYVNLIDFTASTETSLREETLRTLTIEKSQDHTHMTQTLRDQIAEDMAEDFWRFTDITTVPLRLINRKSISGEFINRRTGWFRAQYIRVEGAFDRRPDVVIYTIQNIDADKRREEQLIRISRTDELTRMFNRHSYEEDVAAIRENGVEDDLVLISVDVNGLKAVNDSLGHAAGDELIKGAALCLFSALGSCGRVYRTGGDEFMAILHTRDCGPLLKELRDITSGWKGAAVDSLSLSVGVASSADEPNAKIEELEKLADSRMYEDKKRHYERSGQERRQN
ncbi:MAG: GGDEF domain-containing protein [Oscillospiraceae bacterium]|nr:GGDEF domain-containing protein [Oscillospiraceae bacterium]